MTATLLIALTMYAQAETIPFHKLGVSHINQNTFAIGTHHRTVLPAVIVQSSNIKNLSIEHPFLSFENYPSVILQYRFHYSQNYLTFPQ